MKQVKKSLVDELLNLRREWWERARAHRVRKVVSMEITHKAMNVEREIRNTVAVEFDFDDLANIVARNKLSNECYYGMLRACGFEVAE